jgi:hypothetical protein
MRRGQSLSLSLSLSISLASNEMAGIITGQVVEGGLQMP